MGSHQFKNIRDKISQLEKGVDFEINIKDHVGLVKFNDKRSRPIPVTKSGIISEDGLYELAGELTRLGIGGKQIENYAYLTKPKYIPKAINFSLIVVSLILIALTFSRAGIFTGNVISNLSNSTIDSLVVVLLTALIGLLVWKLKQK